MTTSMEHSGTFLCGIRDNYMSFGWDPFHTIDDPAEMPAAEHLLRPRVKTYKWKLEGVTAVELTVESFSTKYQGFNQGFRRITFTVDGRIVPVLRVENFFVKDGTDIPQMVVFFTLEGELVINHVRIADVARQGADEFYDTASWCRHPLTPER